jgi:ABC-type glycerol-3-phosphate transport system substrate-binding protein
MRGKRWMAMMAGLFVMALLLGACGGDDDGGTTGPTATGPTGATGETTGETNGGGGGGNEINIQG